MKNKTLLLIACLLAGSLQALSQTDDDFYRGSNEEKGNSNMHVVTVIKTPRGNTISRKKGTIDKSYEGNSNVSQELTPDGPWVVSLGGFYGIRTISFGDSDNHGSRHGNEDVKLKFKDLKGVSATLENKLFLLEAMYGSAESLTLLSGKVYIGNNFMPMSRFQILAHAGIGAAYNKIDDKLLEKNELISLDFGLKLRARYYLTNKFALYAAVNGVLGVMGNTTYDNVKMKSKAIGINGEAGFAFSL